MKTHSGAKKRLRKTSGGKVKRKKCGRRHLMKSKNRKRVRRLGETAYVHSANYDAVRKLLVF